MLIILASKSVYNFASNFRLTYSLLCNFSGLRKWRIFDTSLLFVNMPFTKKTVILIKDLYPLKAYFTQMLLKEFPSKNWNERSVQRLLTENLRHRFSWYASRRRQKAADRELRLYYRACDLVGDLVFSQEGALQTHQPVREISRNIEIRPS